MTSASFATRPFSARLAELSIPHQRRLLDIPFCRAAVAGDLSREEYLHFLTQAYHHVKHTVPLLMAAGAAAGPERRALQDAFAEYIEEERGHDLWILDDITAAGGDAVAARDSRPGRAAELLVAYAYDAIALQGPLAFLGMVHVLEGTSVRAASQAADALAPALGLPPSAFTYLTSHGALDVEHTAFFDRLVDTLDAPEEQELVARSALTFFRLYGDVFRDLEPLTTRAGT
jgi:pyrroloquinoline quinone (PQQ) biosynthesis protein C